jgi:cytochrome c553
MSIRKNLFKVTLLFIAVLFIGLAASNVYATDYCVSCHKDAKFRVQNKMLFDYYNYWEESVHESTGVICIDCHGGDETKSDKDAAHKAKDFSSLTAKDKTSLKNISAVCGKCHEEVFKNFKASKHYATLQKDKLAPNCVTCHGSMNTEIYTAKNIAMGCASCHNKELKQTPEIGKQAEDLLTKINIIRAYKRWVTINYESKQPDTVKDINNQYKDMVSYWHQFNFTRMDKKTQKLLIDLRVLVNKELAEKRKNKR